MLFFHILIRIKDHDPDPFMAKELYQVIKREELEGVQRVRGLWRIYVTSGEARMKLLSVGFSINGYSVRPYDQNPYRPLISNNDPMQQTTKVTISNLPLSIANEEIETMLRGMQCELQTKVAYEYVRDDDNRLTSIKNGNRSVLVATGHLHNHPLPRNAHCANWRCNIWYFNQPKPVLKCFNCGGTGHTNKWCRGERICKACGDTGHLEGTEHCRYFKPNDAYLFGGRDDKLSNFHPCSVTWRELQFASAEHAYTYEKAVKNNRKDIAVSMTRSVDPMEAKRESRKIVTTKKWKEEKSDVMKEVVEAKLKANEQIVSELLSTGDKILAEAVIGEDYWGSGLPKRVAQNTDTENWPGNNKLGRIYMEARAKLQEQRDEYKEIEGGKRKAEGNMEENPTSKQRMSGTTPTKDNGKEGRVDNTVDTSPGRSTTV